jgi:16S rRNA (guanine527-N7)-methyltransferase
MSDVYAPELLKNWSVCREVLRGGFAAWRLFPSEIQWRQLETFFLELSVWNRAINLTTIKEPSDIAIKHILDSIAPLLHEDILSLQNVLDLGTGGGFPGIPLKIMRPGIKLTLVEKSEKKSAFLHSTLGKLGLEGIQIMTHRIERLWEQAGFSHTFDTILIRALAPLPRSISLGFPFVAAGGKIIYYASRLDIPKENLPPGTSVEILPVHLPSTDIDRNLLIITCP